MDDEKKATQDYVRLLSHQLKSPINAIETLLNTILQGYAGEVEEQIRFLIEKAVGRSSEARQTIEDLTDYQLYSEAPDSVTSEVNFSALCTELADNYATSAAERGVTLRKSVSDGLDFIVTGDRSALQQAVRNLIENAVKYTAERGSVVVKVSGSDDNRSCVLEVVDSGSGIPEEEIGDIFKPFYRSFVHRSNIPGTGLGLAIVKKIVENHGGGVSVTSQVGKGSTFTIQLPVLRVEQLLRSSKPRRKVVIIGGVTAGPKTAARLRRLDEDLDITIIESAEFLSYSGCGLPWYISGKIATPRDLMSSADGAVRDIDFFEMIGNIEIKNRTLATSIDRNAKVVALRDLDSGATSTINYDVLVLATGASAVIPDIPGIRQEGIFTLRSLEDAERIRQAMTSGSARDVFVIGGGLIGISAAEEFLDTGARITVLEKKEYILLGLLDRDVANRIEAELGRKGIKILTGINIDGIERTGGGLRISTDRGSFDADLIVISTGVRPNVALGKQSGLEIGPAGGIKVDSYLRSSDENIYAVGDCAESANIITGAHEYWPLGSVSTKMGRIAADNICGKEVAFEGSVGTTMFRMRDLTIARTGLTSRSAWKRGYKVESAVVTGKDRASVDNQPDYIAVKVIADAKSRVILGAQAFGRGDVTGKIAIFACGISHSLTLMDMFKTDLGYAPSFNNPIDISQTACLVLANKLDGLVNTITAEELASESEPVHIVSVCPQGDHSHFALPGSLNIPLERVRTEKLPFDRDSRIVLYSRTSSGAYIAYRHLISRGYRNLAVLEGGALYWQS